MKLELKHLSGYLPYELKIYWEYGRNKEISPWELKCESIDLVLTNQNKPILRPLSDYEKFDEIVLEMSNYDMSMIDENPDILKRLPYDVIELMFKNHIDIYGLIEKGLAIDINTLK